MTPESPAALALFALALAIVLTIATFRQMRRDEIVRARCRRPFGSSGFNT